MRTPGKLLAIPMTLGVTLGATLGVIVATMPAARDAEAAICGERDVLVERLGDTFGEHPVAVGVASNGGILEVLSDTDGLSWTIMITMPDGQSCLMVTGENLEMLPKVAAVVGEQAS